MGKVVYITTKQKEAVFTFETASKNKLKPDSNAQGDHSTFKKEADGNITNTATYKQNSKNPTGFDEVKKVDVKGSSHKDSSGKEVKNPHVHEPKKRP